jgi:hypothetical protein
MNIKFKNPIAFLLLIASILNFNNIKATNDLQPIKKNKISVNFSPEFAYRSVISNSNYTSNFWASERPIPSFSAGFAFMHSFSKKFEIETGLNYSIKGFQIPNIVMTTVDNPDARDPNNLYDVKYKYRFIDIPLKFNTFFKIKKMNCFVSTGAVGNILIDGKALLINKNNKDNRQKYDLRLNESDFSLSGYLGIGIQHRLNNRFVLRSDVHIQHQFLISNSSSNIKRYLFNTGLGISLLYFLK